MQGLNCALRPAQPASKHNSLIPAALPAQLAEPRIQGTLATPMHTWTHITQSHSQFSRLAEVLQCLLSAPQGCARLGSSEQRLDVLRVAHQDLHTQQDGDTHEQAAPLLVSHTTHTSMQ